METLETVAQDLNKLTISGSTQTVLDFIIENYGKSSFSLTKITTALNQNRFQDIKPLFKSEFVKPVAIKVIGMVNMKSSVAVGGFGGEIVTTPSDANLAFEADSIIDIFALATDLGFNIPDIDGVVGVKSSQLNLLLEALHDNTFIYDTTGNTITYGVFKDVYNAINNKLAAVIIEGINSVTNKAPSTLSSAKNLLSQANDIQQVLNVSIEIIPQIKEEGLKIEDMTEEFKSAIVDLFDTLQENSLQFGSEAVFKDSYDSLVDYFEEQNGITIDDNVNVKWRDIIIPQNL